jgi:hypothetical protein
MASNKVPEGLARRVMLTHDQAESGNALRKLVVVEAESKYDAVRLRLHAPGFDEAALLRGLRHGLQRALVPVSNSWVGGVELEDDELVTWVYNYDHVGSKTFRLVTGCVPALLQPLNEVAWNSGTVHVLTGEQRLVVVDVHEGGGPYGLDLTFPGELKVTGWPDEQFALDKQLREALRWTEADLSVLTRERGDELGVIVLFNPGRGRPRSGVFDGTVRTMVDEVANRSSAPGWFNQLVFTYDYEAWVDDGSEPAERFDPEY